MLSVLGSVGLARGPLRVGDRHARPTRELQRPTANGNPVVIWSCNGTGARQWTVGGGNTLHVQGKCLDVAGGATANGTLVQLYDGNDTAAQVSLRGPGGSLRNPQSNRCLDDPASSTTFGTQVAIWDCNAAGNQRWFLPGIRVSEGGAAPEVAPRIRDTAWFLIVEDDQDRPPWIVTGTASLSHSHRLCEPPPAMSSMDGDEVAPSKVPTVRRARPVRVAAPAPSSLRRSIRRR